MFTKYLYEGLPMPALYVTLAIVQLFAPAVIGPVILADPDDDIVLATAVAGGADAIVSGDAHLLGIGEFRGIPIVTPAAAASRLTV